MPKQTEGTTAEAAILAAALDQARHRWPGNMAIMVHVSPSLLNSDWSGRTLDETTAAAAYRRLEEKGLIRLTVEGPPKNDPREVAAVQRTVAALQEIVAETAARSAQDGPPLATWAVRGASGRNETSGVEPNAEGALAAIERYAGSMTEAYERLDPADDDLPTVEERLAAIERYAGSMTDCYVGGLDDLDGDWPA